MGIHVGIRLGSIGSGGDLSPPVITNEVYTPGSPDTLTADVSEGGTYYAAWHTGSTITDAALITLATGAAPTATGTYSYGPTVFTVDDSALTAGTWYFDWLVMDASGNKARGTQRSQVVASGYTETWAGLANGNGYTELNTGRTANERYTRSASVFVSNVATSASAPSGLELQTGASSGTGQDIHRADMDAAIAANEALGTPLYIEALAKIRPRTGATNQRSGFGFRSTTNVTGFRIVRSALNTNAIAYGIGINISTGTGGSGSTTYTGMSALADNADIWLRMRRDFDTLRLKVWTGLITDEPANGTQWTTGVVNPAGAGTLITFSNLHLIAYTGSDAVAWWGYSMDIGNPAPSF